MTNNQNNLNTDNISNVAEAQGLTPSKRAEIWTDIGYDSAILCIIIFDLFLLLIDSILMSSVLKWVASQITEFSWMSWLPLENWVTHYRDHWHETASAIGDVITVILIAELLIRWAWAIIQKKHYRWFFFPFVNWYEVLGCFPQLRALRLLRAIAIGRRFYQLGYRWLPEKWLQTARFYYNLVLEEISDRVILTATDNFRHQLTDSQSHQTLIKQTIDNNKQEIETMIKDTLNKELAPRLQQALNPTHGKNPLAVNIGNAIQDAINNTPELGRYLRMIPIAGGMLESQLLSIGQQVGENLADAITQRLLDDKTLTSLFNQIAQGVVDVDVNNPALEKLIGGIITDGLTAFEEQVKVQQWKHHEHILSNL